MHVLEFQAALVSALLGGGEFGHCFCCNAKQTFSLIFLPV